MPLTILGLGFAGGFVALAVAAGLNASRHLPIVIAVVLAALMGLAAIAWRCSSRPPMAALVGVIALNVIIAAVVFGYFKQLANLVGYSSARPFCEEIRAAIEPDDAVFFYDSYRPNIHFYLRRHVPEFNRSNAKVAEALSDTSQIFLIVQDRDMDNLAEGKAILGYDPEEITRQRVGSRNMVFVRVQPTGTRD
jgi:hypothetical protein